MAGDKIINLDRDIFEKEVIQSDIPVVVDFWASWCGPCRAVAPIMDQLADKYDGRVKVAKVNVDEQSELASRFKVMSIPTIMVFKNGQAVEKLIGARSFEEFSKLIDKNL